MEAAELQMVDMEYHVPAADVFDVAAQSTCSAYDCEFVALAKQYNVPLVTVDKKILREFPQTAVSPDLF